MLHNNNFKGNLKLGEKIYNESKVRNLILRISILLTTVLITVGIGCIITMEKIDNLLLTPTGEQTSYYHNIAGNINVERISGIGNYVESKEYKLISFEKENIYLKFISYDDLKNKLKDKLILGKIPTDPSEILLPTWMISGDQYNKDENWRNIYFNTSIIDREKSDKIIKNKRTYKVVGYYNEEPPKNKNEYIEIYGLIDYENTTINSFVTLFTILTLISGYLLITNIFYTSVVNDTRFYGILKTIGLSKSGMMTIIYYQGFFNYLTSLPFGLLFGGLLSKLFIPKLLGITKLNDLNISPNGFEVYIISSMFVFGVVFLCCNKPIKYINSVSPVEASKFIGSEKNITKTTKEFIKERNVLSRIAMYNLFSNERKSFTTILSICISGITIILSMVYYFSFDIDEAVNKNLNNDFTLSIPQISSTIEETKILDHDILNKIKELPYIDSIEENYNIITSLEDNNMIIQGVQIYDDHVLPFSPETEEEKYLFGSQDDKSKSIVINSNDNIKFNTNEKQYSYYENNGIIALNLPEEMRGKNIYLDLIIDGKVVKEEFLVIDVLNDKPFSGIIMSSYSYKKIFKKEPVLTSINITIKGDEYLEEANNELLNIIDNHNISNSIKFTSRYNLINNVLAKLEGLFFIGVILSFFIGMIGFISIINSMLSNVVSRNVEFALFESIGMTKKQQRKMLIYEGINYSLYTTVILIPSSFLVNIFILGKTTSDGQFNIIVYFISLICVILIMTLIMVTIPLLCIKYLKGKTVVERIRESEII